MTVHYFFEIMLSVTYINSVTHGILYFVDYTFRPGLTFVDKWRKTGSEIGEGPNNWFERTHEQKNPETINSE